jgi:protein gp37
MGKKSAIEWTQNTWNPWQGCHKISPGCKYCYMYRDKIRYGQDPFTVVRSKPVTFNAPLKWTEPALVFTCSWSDWFVEEADEWRPEAWDVIRKTPHLTYQILTKRPENIMSRLPKDWAEGWPNVWLGTSVESQEYMWRAEKLLEVPAQTRFLSCEPLLGPLDLSEVLSEYPILVANPDPDGDLFMHTKIHWVISGGESGYVGKCREADPNWFRSIRDQCASTNTAYFHKQHGGTKKIGHIWGGRELDGRTWDELPLAAEGVS